MTASPELPRFSPELRASIFHFTVYLSGAVASVYFGIWLAGHSITPDEIGIINAVPVFLMLGVNLFIGRIADKASDWRQVIIIMSVLSGISALALFFVSDFWGILIVWAMINLPAGSIPPIVDAATLRMTQRRGTDFGFVRAWGTVGYTLAAALSGFAIAWLGRDAFVPLLVGMALLRTVLALQLPRFRAPAREPTVSEVIQTAGRLVEVLRPWFILPLIAFALLQSTHALIGAFVALVWKEHGISEAFIGPLMAISAFAEASLMFAWKRFGGRISARHMILIAAVTTIVRWVGLAMGPPVVVLFLLQALHAITFGVGYLGMVHFIATWTNEEMAAEAQSFAFVLQQTCTVVVLLAFGWLIGAIGQHAFFVAGGLGALAVICVAISLRLRPVHNPHSLAKL